MIVFAILRKNERTMNKDRNSAGNIYYHNKIHSKLKMKWQKERLSSNIIVFSIVQTRLETKNHHRLFEINCRHKNGSQSNS